MRTINARWGGLGGDWRLSVDNTGYFPISPGGIHHPEELVPTHIGEAT